MYWAQTWTRIGLFCTIWGILLFFYFVVNGFYNWADCRKRPIRMQTMDVLQMNYSVRLNKFSCDTTFVNVFPGGWRVMMRIIRRRTHTKCPVRWTPATYTWKMNQRIPSFVSGHSCFGTKSMPKFWKCDHSYFSSPADENRGRGSRLKFIYLC